MGLAPLALGLLSGPLARCPPAGRECVVAPLAHRLLRSPGPGGAGLGPRLGPSPGSGLAGLNCGAPASRPGGGRTPFRGEKHSIINKSGPIRSPLGMGVGVGGDGNSVPGAGAEGVGPRRALKRLLVLRHEAEGVRWVSQTNPKKEIENRKREGSKEKKKRGSRLSGMEACPSELATRVT